MPDPFYFGDRQRLLFGLRHGTQVAPNGALLVCGPLLQENIRCQRALWSLGQAMAAQGTEVLRFDWYGSGDSGGDSRDMNLSGLISDIAVAKEQLMLAKSPVRRRLLGLRSAAIPLLLQASSSATPVDIVLWAPVLEGPALVAAWREQHRRQLYSTGRFPKSPLPADDNELLGFVVDDALLDALQAFKYERVALPEGSRLLLVQWQASPCTDEFMRRQRAAGVEVECLQLAPSDEPDWDNPDDFETQIFRRMAVSRVAAYLAETA